MIAAMIQQTGMPYIGIPVVMHSYRVYAVTVIHRS